MLTFIYEWMKNIAFYLIVLIAVMQMIPNNSYQKYIRFFAGMILILMLAEPIFHLFGMENYHNEEYQNVVCEIEAASEYMEKETEKLMEGSMGEEETLGD